jgi:hypothetical protein
VDLLGTLARKPAAAALIAFVVALPALAILKQHSAPHYAVSHANAVNVARANPQVARALARYGYTRARVSPLDDQHQRVSFFRGARLVLHAAVGSRGRVTYVAVRTPGSPSSGA